jgi:hypothetical protein
LTAGGGWTTAFMPSPTGFMHPWSLAARQQKAAAEQQDRTPTAMCVPRWAKLRRFCVTPYIHHYLYAGYTEAWHISIYLSPCLSLNLVCRISFADYIGIICFRGTVEEVIKQ